MDLKMTEQLICRIYKIINIVDDKIYIGSTRRSLSCRMSQHRLDAKNGKKKPIAKHIRDIGADNFKIELVKQSTVSSRKEMRIEEQNEIEKYDKAVLLNKVRAFSDNHDKTRDIIKKRQNRRDFYHRHKEDPEWIEKERERNRLRMQRKRALLKEQTEAKENK